MTALRETIVRVSAGLIAVASVALFILMLVVAADVVLRNLGVFYIAGVSDYVTLAQIALTACAIPAAFVEGRHLVVEIGTYHLEIKTNARLESIWLLLGCPVLAQLGVWVLDEGLHMTERGRTIGILGWSTNTYHVPVAVGLFLAATLCLVVGLSRASGRPSF